MGKNVSIDVNRGSSMDYFAQDVAKTLVQQDDYRGIGGHGSENHGGHGSHSQVSIGIGDTTLNIRTIDK